MSDSDENGTRRTVRNLEVDYDKAEKLAALKEEKNVKEVRKKPTHMSLKFYLEPPKEKAVEKKEEDDALPLTCPICKESFLDPVLTRCIRYFCRHCALKHHEKDNKCFVCKQPTLGVFNASEEMQQKINQVRQKAKAMLKEVSETMKKALGIVTDAETMKAASVEMVKEAELLVQIAISPLAISTAALASCIIAAAFSAMSFALAAMSTLLTVLTTTFHLGSDTVI